MQVLSTKILTTAQRELLPKKQIELIDYSAIQVIEKDFKLPPNMEYVLFTSQNTVHFFLKKARKSSLNLSSLKAFCVGEKTAALLRSNNINVIDFRHYAADLSKLIIAEYPRKIFTFFCGEQRRDTLPSAFIKNKIEYSEVQLYQTQLNPKAWKLSFPVILFFSPTGVESFLLKNTLSHDQTAICIGTTTAEGLKNTQAKILLARKPTVEEVLFKTLAFYNNQLL